jgi:hypothetical protein
MEPLPTKDFDNGHMATINARYMSYGNIPRTTVLKTVSFQLRMLQLSGYAYQFEEDWTIGGGLNFITSKIDNYTSSFRNCRHYIS